MAYVSSATASSTSMSLDKVPKTAKRIGYDFVAWGAGERYRGFYIQPIQERETGSFAPWLDRGPGDVAYGGEGSAVGVTWNPTNQ